MPFECASPEIDERAVPNEAPEALVQRLAVTKAAAVGRQRSDALVIGSDQVACCDGEILGKPGHREAAIDQLRAFSGRTVVFHTGLCLLNSASERRQVVDETFHVHFRELSDAQIARYVDREQPFDCAGSFKSEGLGIALFSALEGRDPNALIGLPLIALIEMLAKEGIEVP